MAANNRTPKTHLHDEQFDGHQHAWCGRGTTAVSEDVFEATPEADRCVLCDREWFPHGQPDWHFEQAVKRANAQPEPVREH